MQELSTAQQVFAALGGVRAVADITGRKYPAAFNWKMSGKFPPNTFVAMQEALRDRAYVAPDSLWGMVPANDGKIDEAETGIGTSP